MSNINVWNVDEDLTDDAQEEDTVKLPTVNKNDSVHKSFETDSEELEAVRYILKLLDDLNNGEAIIITKDVW